MIRPTLVTAQVVAFAAAAHAIAGGALPPVADLVPLIALVWLISAALDRRLLPLPVAAGLTTIGQVLLHLAAVTSAAHPTHVGPGAPHGHDHGGWQMLVAHAASAALTVIALRQQSRAADWVLRAFAVPHLPRLLPAVALPLADRSRWLGPADAKYLQPLLRGPPRLGFVPLA